MGRGGGTVSGDDRPGIVHALLELLSDLSEGADRSRGSGLGSDVAPGFGDSPSRADVDDARDDGSPRGPEPNRSPPVLIRRVDEGLLVAADLPGVRTVDVSADLNGDRGTVRLAAHREEIGRLPVAEGGWRVIDVGVTNGVMEMRLRDD